MYMMEYLKGFNEANITDEFLSELKDFCEMNLVYLMDDGLQVKVKSLLGSHLSCVTLVYPLDIAKNFDGIKDHIIPFFTRLNSQYNVITFGQLPWTVSNSTVSTAKNSNQIVFGYQNVVNSTVFSRIYTVDDVIGDSLDSDNNLIVEIKFYVSSNDDVIKPVKRSIGSRVKKFLGFNESVGNLQDELHDLCDTCLSPLVDDGFTYEVTPTWNGEFDIRLSKPYSSTIDDLSLHQLYDYTEVMDRFIPLVRILSTRYDVRECIYFYTTEEWDINKKVFSLEQIMNDEGPDFLVTSVKLTVKSRKG
jgi:hypothetical protein